MSTIPEHIKQNTGMTSREWKQLKRRQLRETINLIRDDLLCGAAYLPEEDTVSDCLRDLRRLQDKMSVKNWGR